jgi:hypothetical protein
VPTFADRECHMVSVTDPYGRILGFLDQEIVCITVNITYIIPFMKKQPNTMLKASALLLHFWETLDSKICLQIGYLN